MNFNDETVNRIGELAALLTPVRDIAAIMGIDEDMLRLELATKGSPAREAYLRAKALTTLELRRQEIELARIGSPLAVQLTASYLSDMTSDEDF